jgi:hypothetical protein
MLLLFFLLSFFWRRENRDPKLPPGNWQRPSRFFYLFRSRPLRPQADPIPTSTPAATLHIEVVGDYQPPGAIDRLAMAALGLATLAPFLGVGGTFCLVCGCLRIRSPFKHRRKKTRRGHQEMTPEESETSQTETSEVPV